MSALSARSAGTSRAPTGDVETDSRSRSSVRPRDRVLSHHLSGSLLATHPDDRDEELRRLEDGESVGDRLAHDLRHAHRLDPWSGAIDATLLRRAGTRNGRPPPPADPLAHRTSPVRPNGRCSVGGHERLEGLLA